jgi:hypothetical protein
MRRAMIPVSPRSHRMYSGSGQRPESDSESFEQSTFQYRYAKIAKTSSYSDDTFQSSQKPSLDYLANSLLPSISPSASRKLLVLDLNGSLLLRSARRPRTKAPSPRIVYPRPYMAAFSAYLFHEETMKWLDTMVWSSAQPHSVRDMVNKCFGKNQAMLAAIWTREDMGLSQADYCRYREIKYLLVLRFADRKSDTLKDLTRVWAELNSRVFDGATPPRDSFELRLATSHSSSSSGSSNLSIHSAQTTLLLDDSPLKATLQPFNLLCIREYDRATRARDLRVLVSQNRPSARWQYQHSWREGNDSPEMIENEEIHDSGKGEISLETDIKLKRILEP